MSNQEFENYVALIGRLLQLNREQRDQISVELQDHLQMRLADLTSEGVSKTDAISQALEEFGDAAVMAKNFQTVINLKRRRWIMRFATFSIAGVFLAAIFTIAMWPDNARFGTPNHSIAQATATEDGANPKTDAPTVLNVSDATKRNLVAEETLKKIVSLNYDEQPFNEIEEELEKMTGLNFLLHSSAQDDSLTEDEPMTSKLNNLPLNIGLQLMLETKNATYVIDEGVVLVISLDDAEHPKWHRLRMFDCRELVEQLPKTSLSASEPVASSETTLVNLVQSMVEPDSWGGSQGHGQVDVVNGILVVKQTEALLRQVENLIRDLEGNVLRKGTKVGLREPLPTNPMKRHGFTPWPDGMKLPKSAVHVTAEEDPFAADLPSGDEEHDPFGK